MSLSYHPEMTEHGPYGAICTDGVPTHTVEASINAAGIVLGCCSKLCAKDLKINSEEEGALIWFMGPSGNWCHITSPTWSKAYAYMVTHTKPIQIVDRDHPPETHELISLADQQRYECPPEGYIFWYYDPPEWEMDPVKTHWGEDLGSDSRRAILKGTKLVRRPVKVMMTMPPPPEGYEYTGEYERSQGRPWATTAGDVVTNPSDYSRPILKATKEES